MSHLELLDRREVRHSGQISSRGFSTAYRLFFKESIRSFRPTASIFPSSRYLADALLRPIDFRKARIIVELGPGTGAVTGEILKRLRPDGRLLAIDINPVFTNHLRTACDDPRLTPVDGSATDLLSLLALHEAGSIDAVVSSLGLTRMENRIRVSIVASSSSLPGCPRHHDAIPIRARLSVATSIFQNSSFASSTRPNS